MAGAKRDFESVKSSRNATDPTKTELSGLTAPELSLTKPTPKTKARAKTPAELLAEKKSANWLVDAMMKKDEKNSKGEAVDPDEAELLEAKLNPEVAARAALEKPVEEKPAEKTSTAKTGPEFNPLTRFMSGWMTPQDYSLLKPGLGGASADSLVARGEISSTGPTGDLNVATDKAGALETMSLSRSSSLATAVSPSANPYLQAFTPPTQGVASFSLPGAPASPAPTTSTFTPPAEPPPAKARMPDFAKPVADEKYFKQLKRF